MELDKAAFADGLHGLLKVCAVKLRVLLRKLLDGKRHALFHRKTDVENVVGHLLVVLVGGVLQRGVDAQILRGFGSDLVLAEQCLERHVDHTNAVLPLKQRRDRTVKVQHPVDGDHRRADGGFHGEHHITLQLHELAD